MKTFWVSGQLSNYHWFQLPRGLHQIMHMEQTPVTFLRNEDMSRAERAAVPKSAHRGLVVKDK